MKSTILPATTYYYNYYLSIYLVDTYILVVNCRRCYDSFAHSIRTIVSSMSFANFKELQLFQTYLMNKYLSTQLQFQYLQFIFHCFIKKKQNSEQTLIALSPCIFFQRELKDADTNLTQALLLPFHFCCARKISIASPETGRTGMDTWLSFYVLYAKSKSKTLFFPV